MSDVVTKKRILVIDDEDTVLRALTLLLEAIGFAPIPALGGIRALQVVTSGESLDFILCDLRMPEMSGIELLNELTRMTCPTPFILMSGHASPDEVQESFKCGAVGFLAKPFTPDMLEEIIVNNPKERGPSGSFLKVA